METDKLIFGESFALDTTGKGAIPMWNEIATIGAFKGHAAGPFEITLDTFQQIIDNFHEDANRRIPIDFDHASEQDPTAGSKPVVGAPACGWILDLKIKGNSLWGLCQWGETARKYIRDGAYRFFSPAIRFNSRDRVTGEQVGARMSSGALTNQPFLSGMQALVASTNGTTADRPQLTDHPTQHAHAALTAVLRGGGAGRGPMTLTAAANAAHSLATGHRAPLGLRVDVDELERRMAREEVAEARRLMASTPGEYANGVDLVKAKSEARLRSRQGHRLDSPSEAITSLCLSAQTRSKRAFDLSRAAAVSNGTNVVPERETWVLPLMSDRLPWRDE